MCVCVCRPVSSAYSGQRESLILLVGWFSGARKSAYVLGAKKDLVMDTLYLLTFYPLIFNVQRFRKCVCGHKN